MTASQLRKNIYRLLDEVLETGEPLEIERKGRRLRSVPEPEMSKFAALKSRPCIVGDPEDLVHMDWSDEGRRSPRLGARLDA